MVFKRNDSTNRRAPDVRARTFAAVCAIGAGILVVPGRRGVSLSGADSRDLFEGRPRLVVFRHRRAACKSRRRRRRVARGPAVVPVRPVGVVVGDRRRRAGRRGLSPGGATRRRDRPSAGAGRAGFRAGAFLPALRWRRSGCGSCRRRCRWRRAVRSATPSARGSPAPSASMALRCCCWRSSPSARRCSSASRGSRSWSASAPGSKRSSAGFAAGARRRVDRKLGDEATIEREHVVSQLREVDEEREPVLVVPPRSAGAAVRARRQGEAAAALHRHARFAVAAAGAARGRAVGAGVGQHRNARLHVAAHRAQARGLRRDARRCSPPIPAR